MVWICFCTWELPYCTKLLNCIRAAKIYPIIPNYTWLYLIIPNFTPFSGQYLWGSNQLLLNLIIPYLSLKYGLFTHHTTSITFLNVLYTSSYPCTISVCYSETYYWTNKFSLNLFYAICTSLSHFFLLFCGLVWPICTSEHCLYCFKHLYNLSITSLVSNTH